MILQDHLARIVDGRAHRCQLHQHLGAVVALFYHTLDLFQMTDGTGQTVHHRLLILMDVAMGMGNAVGMLIGVIVVMVMSVVMIVIMGMIFLCLHRACLLLFLHIIPHFYPLRKPIGGLYRKK